MSHLSTLAELVSLTDSQKNPYPPCYYLAKKILKRAWADSSKSPYSWGPWSYSLTTRYIGYNLTDFVGFFLSRGWKARVSGVAGNPHKCNVSIKYAMGKMQGSVPLGYEKLALNLDLLSLKVVRYIVEGVRGQLESDYLEIPSRGNYKLTDIVDICRAAFPGHTFEIAGRDGREISVRPYGSPAVKPSAPEAEAAPKPSAVKAKPGAAKASAVRAAKPKKGRFVAKLD